MARESTVEAPSRAVRRTARWPESYASLASGLLRVRIDTLKPWLDRPPERLDAEALHRLRAEVRRLRSTLWLVRPLAGPAAKSRIEPLRARAKRVARALGAVRDVDELLGHLSPGTAAVATLRARREGALRALRPTLHRAGFRSWPSEIEACRKVLRTPGTALGDADPRALASALLRKRRKRLKSCLRRLDARAPMETFHKARRRAKQLGDLLDDLEPWLGRGAEPLRRDVRRLRSALGRLQDAVVAEAEFARLARRLKGDGASRELRKLVRQSRSGQRRALERSLGVARGMSPRHWRRVRDTLPPPLDLEDSHERRESRPRRPPRHRREAESASLA